MMSKMLLSMSLATLSLVLSASCSSRPKRRSLAVSGHETIQPRYVAVSFQEGKAELDEKNKEHVEDFLRTSKITRIRILAWADEEYPETGPARARPKQVILAEDRSQNLETMLKSELKDSVEIETYNMARRPSTLEKMLKTDDYRVKDQFEKSGATSVRLPDGQVSYTKASKAIIIVEPLASGGGTL